MEPTDEYIDKIYNKVIGTFDIIRNKLKQYNPTIHGIGKSSQKAFMRLLDKYETKLRGPVNKRNAKNGPTEEEKNTKNIIRFLIKSLSREEKQKIKDLYIRKSFIELINKIYNLSKPITELVNYRNVRLLLWYNKLLIRLIKDLQAPLRTHYIIK